MSSRGFGARASFGVRGVRLHQDDIPATMPDGQGQTGSFSLLSARAIEVLRGPFSSLYGNASGGVIAVFTEDGRLPPSLTANVGAGSYGARTAGLKANGVAGSLGYVVADIPVRHRRVPAPLRGHPRPGERQAHAGTVGRHEPHVARERAGAA